MSADSDALMNSAVDEPRHCAVFRPLLSDYADGEATATEAALIEEHLKGCSSCTSRLTLLQVTDRLVVAAMPEMQAPSELFARIAASTYRRPTLRQRILDVFRPIPVRAALGSAFALAVAAAVVVPRLGGTPTVITDKTQKPMLAQEKPVTPSTSPLAPSVTKANPATQPSSASPSAVIAANRTPKTAGKDKTNSTSLLASASPKPSMKMPVTAKAPTANVQIARLAAHDADLQRAIAALNAVKPASPSRPLAAVIRPRSSFTLMDRSKQTANLHPVVVSASGGNLLVPASALEPEQHRAIAATVPVSVSPLEVPVVSAAESVAPAPHGLRSDLLLGSGSDRPHSTTIASRGNRQTAISSSRMVSVVEAPVN